MAEIKLRCSPRIITGSSLRVGSDALPDVSSALLLSDMIHIDTASAIRDSLDQRGVDTIIFTREDLRNDTVNLEEALSVTRGARSKAVIGLGGEGVLSLARFVAAAASETFRAVSMTEPGIASQLPQSLPLLEIPTGGRHSLMFRNEALLVNDGDGHAVFPELPLSRKRTVLLDPALSACAPSSAAAFPTTVLTAAAAEAFLGPAATFLSDIQARSALESAAALASENAEGHGETSYRLKEFETAVTAALGTGLTGPGPGMLLAWSVAASCGLARAAVYGVLLPWLLESPLYLNSPKLEAMSYLLAGENGSGNPAEDVRLIWGRLGIPGRLKDIGLDSNLAMNGVRWAAGMPGHLENALLNESLFCEILETAF